MVTGFVFLSLKCRDRLLHGRRRVKGVETFGMGEGRVWGDDEGV
jgi:hypothetical protein